MTVEALKTGRHTMIDFEHGDKVYTITIVPAKGEGYVNFYGVDVTAHTQAERALKRMLSRTSELYETSRRIGLAQTAADILHILQANSYFAHASRIVVSVFNRPWLDDDDPPEIYELFAELDDSSLDDSSIPRSTGGRRLAPEVRWLINRGLRYGPIHVGDIGNTMLFSGNTTINLAEANVRSITAFPLTARGQWYGALAVLFAQESELSDEEMRHAQGLVDEAAIAIHNMRLFQSAAEARREAEQANDSRLKFLAMISHELRTPLTPIKGLVTTLLADDVRWDANEQRDFLNIINQETDRLVELIEQMLDLSRLEAGLSAIQPRPTRLQQIVMATVTQLLDIALNHILKLDLADDLPIVNADGRRIAQVIANLVSNAARYSPAGTTITISAHLAVGQMQVDVADNGPGIPKLQQPYLFKAFYRGDDEKARQTKGMGLGLAICKRIVEAHSGNIWLNTTAGPGAVFSFTLPLAT